jgi:hypothetical protein
MNTRRIALLDEKTDKNVINTVKFLKNIINDKSIKIVCFDDLWYETLTGPDYSMSIIKWSNSINYENYLKLWNESYEAIDNIIHEESSDAKIIFEVYRHYCAEVLLKLKIIEFLIKQTDEILIITIEGSKRFYQGYKAEVSSNRRLISRMAGVMSSLLGHLFKNSKVEKDSFRPCRKDNGLTDILIVVEDSLSLVNYNSAIHVVNNIKNKSIRPTVITSNEKIIELFNNYEVQVINCKSHLAKIINIRSFYEVIQFIFIMNRVIRRNKSSTSTVIFLNFIKYRAFNFIGFKNTTNNALNSIEFTGHFDSLLTVNESSPLAILATHWASKLNLTSYGLWPALVGNRPDYNNFGADFHLVYGDQMKEHMKSINIKGSIVEVVGIPAYDDILGMSYQDSVKVVKNKFLSKWNAVKEKLVVVATEAMQNPLEEIFPVLTALVRMEKVVIILKIHPSDSVIFYMNFLKETGYEDRIIVVADTSSLHELLKSADLLICINSNIIVAAAILNTITLVCDFSNKRKSLDFVESGLCIGCFEESQVNKYISKMLFDENFIKNCKNMIRHNISKYNGNADQCSSDKIVNIIAKCKNNTDKCQ